MVLKIMIMSILITGGAGFIGSNLAGELLKQDYSVIILDDLSTGRERNLREFKNRITFVKGSITNLELLKKICKDVSFVFHQAALASVQRSIEEPKKVTEVNIIGTLNVLLAARDSGVEKVIYASSSSVYGDTLELPKRESMQPMPKSPYAVSKLAGEHYCSVFTKVYGLQAICLRYFNVYGPKQSAFSEYAAVIPRFIARVLKNQPPIIFGSGEQTRDFTFVKDAVKANILAMKSNATGVFNIASGKRISINELAYKIISMLGKKLKPEHAEPRKGDVMHSLADISLAGEKLGYKPSYDIDKGLKETIEYFKKVI